MLGKETSEAENSALCPNSVTRVARSATETFMSKREESRHKETLTLLFLEHF